MDDRNRTMYSSNGNYVQKTRGAYYTRDGFAGSRSHNGINFSDGSVAYNSGNNMVVGSNVIHVSGNSLLTSTGEIYRLTRHILVGPNGKVWSGVASIEDAKAIVAIEMKRKRWFIPFCQPYQTDSHILLKLSFVDSAFCLVA